MKIKGIMGGLLFLFLSGCVTTGEMELIRSDMAKLYAENSQLKQEVKELRTRIDKMSSDLNTATALKEGHLTLLAQTQDYIKELQMLKGRFEENSINNDKKFKELNDKILELQKKIAQPSQPLSSKELMLSKELEGRKDSSEGLKNPKELYDEAHLALKEKKYNVARAKLEEIIKNYPNFELLPNSYFWVAETYYNEKNFEEAILSYEEFLKRYPKHEKAPGALLKEGMAFLELKDKKTAKVVFERVIEKYPKSPEAEVAQKKIAEILKSQNTSTKPKRTKSNR